MSFYPIDGDVDADNDDDGDDYDDDDDGDDGGDDDSTAIRYTAGRLPTINMGRPFA